MARVLTQAATPVKQTPTAPRARGARWLIVTVVVVIAVAAVIGASTMRKSAGDRVANLPTFTVVRGPLTISTTVSGTIRSRQQETIKCEVEGQSTIIYLIPEGTHVKKGDLLVELDASKLEDQKVSQQIVVQNAEAAKIRAAETLAVARSQAQSDIAKAELDLRFAKEDLVKYIQGDYKNELETAESKISVAKEELTRTEEKLKWSKILFDEKYLSQTELQADELAFTRAKLDLQLANNAKKLLQEFTYKRKKDELESAISQAEMALDRITRKAKADVVQAEADQRAKDSEFTRQQGVLEKVLRMLAKTKMYAPVDGMVVYATSSEGGFRGNREPLDEGQTVRERQDLIHLPTTSSVMAEVKVHESNLDKVTLGLPVRVTIDALPGRVFTGKVAKIGLLPDATSAWMNPDLKVYNTEIHLDEGDAALRTGMSCRAEIVVDWYADAVYVPVQSVVRVGGKPTVYIPTPDGSQSRNIELGLDNNRMVHVLSGLQVGEQVLLSPPLAEATAQEQPMPNGGMPKPPAGATTRPAVAAPVTGAVPAAGPRDRAQHGAGGPDSGRPAEAREDRRAQQGDRSMQAPGREGPGRGANLTPEQREEMRKRFESMTPEQREEMRRQMMERRQGRGGQGGREGRQPQ